SGRATRGSETPEVPETAGSVAAVFLLGGVVFALDRGGFAQFLLRLAQRGHVEWPDAADVAANPDGRRARAHRQHVVESRRDRACAAGDMDRMGEGQIAAGAGEVEQESLAWPRMQDQRAGSHRAPAGEPARVADGIDRFAGVRLK